MRAIGCPRPWTAPWRSTSSCWTAGRERGPTGQSLDRSSTCWTSWSATPTLWRGPEERPLSGERARYRQTQKTILMVVSSYKSHTQIYFLTDLLPSSHAESFGFYLCHASAKFQSQPMPLLVWIIHRTHYEQVSLKLLFTEEIVPIKTANSMARVLVISHRYRQGSHYSGIWLLYKFIYLFFLR